jgi:hypothetical protein
LGAGEEDGVEDGAGMDVGGGAGVVSGEVSGVVVCAGVRTGIKFGDRVCASWGVQVKFWVFELGCYVDFVVSILNGLMPPHRVQVKPTGKANTNCTFNKIVREHWGPGDWSAFFSTLTIITGPFQNHS